MFLPLSEAEKALFEAENFLTAESDGTVSFSCADKKAVIQDHKQLNEIARELLRERYRKEDPMINAIAQMNTKPISIKFGMERRTAIDRYYIEDFLEKNRELIYGDCLEIAENTYTLKYGGGRVKNSYILHVMGWGNNAIKGNLATGEGIEAEKYDCAVISRYDAERWGSYYGFHEGAMKALFEPLFGEENVMVHSYGNVKTAIAMLYGLCGEDLCEEDFKIQDPDYPVVISIILKKQ